MFNHLLKTFSRKSELTPNATQDQPVALDRPVPLDVTDANFAEIVLGSDKLVVVDFWAEWCEPCQVMSAYVGFLANDYADRVLVAAIDVDANPETPARYDVMGLPTVVFFRNGEEVDRQLGVVDYQMLRQRVEQQLSTDSSLITQPDVEKGADNANN